MPLPEILEIAFVLVFGILVPSLIAATCQTWFVTACVVTCGTVAYLYRRAQIGTFREVLAMTAMLGCVFLVVVHWLVLMFVHGKAISDAGTAVWAFMWHNILR